MTITGIESLIYGVDDIETSTRFFEDFGLPLVSKNARGADFRLEEGSKVLIRAIDDPLIPASSVEGIGVREAIWGVDDRLQLEALTKDLSRDREVRRDEDGTIHFLSDCGLPLGLRYFQPKRVVAGVEPVNAAGHVNRLNSHRKWRHHAQPKFISHVVFRTPDPAKSFAFFHDRLDFRLTDTQRSIGMYARAPGSNLHHNIFFYNSTLPWFDGKVRFDHVNYGVEDIDEIMVGANHMKRCGWPDSHVGLGRHRIDSALFFYLPCPAGGEAEYGADGDLIDDDWVPRDWDENFGYAIFVHNLPQQLMTAPRWDVNLLPERVHKKSGDK